MKSDDILFSKIKEDRGWYFVEYTPPMLNYRFSVLQLSVIELPDLETVATALEAEAKDWLSRYPVPLMVTAFAIDESVLPLENVRPIDHLMAWVDTSSRSPILKWELIGDDNLPNIALNREYLKEVFKAFPSKTGLDINRERAKQVNSDKMVWWLVLVWTAVPFLWVLAERYSEKLSFVVFAYAIFKVITELLKVTGKLPKSKRKLQKESEEAQMRHHYYHCIRNPDAFERLKLENFQKEAIERTLAESKAIKASSQVG